MTSTDKALDCVTDLPEQTRKALVDFLTVSSRAIRAPEAVAEELVDSIALKSCLAAVPRA